MSKRPAQGGTAPPPPVGHWGGGQVAWEEVGSWPACPAPQGQAHPLPQSVVTRLSKRLPHTGWTRGRLQEAASGPGDSRPPWPSPPPSPALLSPILTPFLGPEVPEGNPQIRPRAKTRLGGQAPQVPWPVWGASARRRGSRGPSWSLLHSPPHPPALTPADSVAGLKMASPACWAEEGGPS